MMMTIGDCSSPNCDWKAAEVFLDVKGYFCPDCMRSNNPPYMTLINFQQGNYKKLWNLEIGMYESFDSIKDLEWCGWLLRSQQETLYRIMPRVMAMVYHLEYHGTVHCGRCVDYKYFTDELTYCMSNACQRVAKPHRSPKEIDYPPQESYWSRYKGLRNA